MSAEIAIVLWTVIFTTLSLFLFVQCSFRRTIVRKVPSIKPTVHVRSGVPAAQLIPPSAPSPESKQLLQASAVQTDEAMATNVSEAHKSEIIKTDNMPATSDEQFSKERASTKSTMKSKTMTLIKKLSRQSTKTPKKELSAPRTTVSSKSRARTPQQRTRSPSSGKPAFKSRLEEYMDSQGDDDTLRCVKSIEN
uniref:Uncharacterized protein n=1 Tax=Caenorhabditis japonica TaxID=281687 RepID=A0A8R1DEC5_CAEJA